MITFHKNKTNYGTVSTVFDGGMTNVSLQKTLAILAPDSKNPQRKIQVLNSTSGNTHTHTHNVYIV